MASSRTCATRPTSNDSLLRSAHIVNVASIAAHYGQGFMPAYSATKAGVLALSQALHDQLAGDGVRVTALSPSFVATDQTTMLPMAPEEPIQFLRRSEKLFAPM